MLNHDDNRGVELLVSFMIGGIVGAGLALLFAPQSGKRTRGQIVDLADDARDYVADYAKQLKKKVG
ncbi:MAG: YtxH domain-containing protein [Nitrospirae bacterium]|nr:MAG: YtxH domain-containing protein [Nitrospirota bacterium]